MLVLLAPLCAELTFTAVAVPATWLALPLLVPMYGAGVLLAREAVVRVGGGWPSLVLLGLAYQLAEDGLGLQALTSPTIYSAPEWGLRVAGLNLTYWLAQIGIHVVFSILLPVLLADVLLPGHRGRPYLRTPGLAVVAVAAVAGVSGLRFGIAATQDPGYQAPWPVVLGLVAAIALLAVLALRVVPARLPDAAPVATRPVAAHPVVVGGLSAAAVLAFLGLLMPAGLRPGGPALGPAVPLGVPLLLALAVAVGSAWLLRRLVAHPGWDDEHRIWLAGGALVSHTAFMVPGHGAAGMLTGGLTILVEVVALTLLGRRVRAHQLERTGRPSS